jgi:hypothetical protein
MTKHLPFLVMLVACGDGVPDKPTYFVDVQPILRANCVRCHGADPADPKVATFRLDRYVSGDDTTFDVWDYANGDPSPIMNVAVNHEAPAMPPDYTLTDRQRDILARWITQGAEKGIARRDNRAPEIELVSPTGVATADQTLDTTFRAWDADLDGLYVRLWARDLTDPTEPPYSMGPRVGGGQRSVAVDTGTLASQHQFLIYAVLDDGYYDTVEQNHTEVALIPELIVDHGLRGTAPRVEVLAPNGGQTLIGSATILWTATDPDAGDSLTFTVELIKAQPKADGTFEVVETIAPAGTTLPAPAAGMAYSLNWDVPTSVPATDSAGAAIPYKVRVTAEDTLGKDEMGNPAHNVRYDDSDLPIFVAQATVGTTYNWRDDARPILDKFCKDCHAAAGKTPAIDYFCVLKYNAADPDSACEASDDGAYEVKGQIYQRMVQAKTMPPATEPKPTQAELDVIGNWILGGAPGGGGGGPADASPTLTWVAPDASTVLVATGTSPNFVAMLQWTVADAEGLASDALEYVKVAGTNASSNCDTVALPAAPTWKPLTGAGMTLSGMSATRSYDWRVPTIKQGPTTTPDQGCYFVRGTVKDTANHSTPVITPKSVKF